ncbi:MAG: hypothetical protein EXS48_02975 [Candidatus Staskawiczbacteria bacterium]|nr:hypothetical protein [Candidatus Staskawiczbacteria bacterium]
MPKLVTNVGAFVGFLNPKHDGRLLLVRRTSPDSIIPGVSFKGNWELPGGAMEEVDTMVYNQGVVVAFQKAKEKTGMDILISDQPFLGPWYGTSFKGPQGYDLGQIVPCVTEQEPTVGETIWVSSGELDALAQKFISETDAKKQNLPEADGLLSGKGKRMYLMAMSILAHHSPNALYRQDAEALLKVCKP